jgi:hypothetical protein
LGYCGLAFSFSLSNPARNSSCRLFVAMGKDQPETIKREFYRLGIRTAKVIG